jgi:hypothetical protein
MNLTHAEGVCICKTKFQMHIASLLKLSVQSWAAHASVVTSCPYATFPPQILIPRHCYSFERYQSTDWIPFHRVRHSKYGIVVGCEKKSLMDLRLLKWRLPVE